MNDAVKPEEPANRQPTLAITALGVVYGDIGTSPLYTVKECLMGLVPLSLSQTNILGMLSLIFWGLMIVVSIKYVLIILRADNRGEGGVLALMALALRTTKPQQYKAVIISALGLVGAAFFYGDSMITPAISVLSAVEGLSIVSHQFTPYVIPLTIVVLIALFALQRHGTERVGQLFGPIMLVWFAVLALLGLWQVIHHPVVLKALSPHYAILLAKNHPKHTFILLGAVILAFTGAEALYADMGHFGRPVIRRIWFCMVLPSLGLNYFGQGALLLSDPAAIKNPFFLLAPTWALPILVFIATLATVIAAQAVISGAYSMTNQAVQLGFCPRFDIQHTSETEKGQIYLPQINWFLLASVILLVLLFRSSANLAGAYGIAVTCTMVITTLLAFTVLTRQLSWLPKLGMYFVLSAILAFDLLLFFANILKITDGGWVPILIGLLTFILMSTWKKGRRLLSNHLHRDALPLEGFIEALEAKPPLRVEGTAVFMTTNTLVVPHALLHNLKHNKILHQQIVCMTIRTVDMPFVSDHERIVICPLSKTVFQIIASYGFKEDPSVPKILKLAQALQPQLHFDPLETSFFLSRETIVSAKHSAMTLWRRKLFSLMSRNSTRAAQFFKIPPNRVVELGVQVEL